MGGIAYQGVHQGFVNEIRYRLLSTEYTKNIKPRLGSCARVTVAGHSLGGALAEIFSWCAAGGDGHAANTEDYDMIRWSKGSPTLLEAVTEEPTTLINV